MEFLPAQGTPTLDEHGERNGPLTRVRLAWYYRPSDVSDRTVADCRLLLAAIYSEVCDISQLRAKCYVIHRDKITDLAGWKKRPDRFYFQRLFDPWIRKEFEVIQAASVRNLPTNIREVLLSRYEYVVAEKEVVPDLTDELRDCATCEKWCPPPETVQCDRYIEERGDDATVEVLSLVHEMSPKEVDALETYKTTLTRHERYKHNVDWLTEVIKRFSDAWVNGRDLLTVNMKSPLHQEKWKKSETRFIDKDFTDAEVAAFEDAIAIHGAELRPVREEVGSRTMPEVVRFYGHWKSTKLGEENTKIKAARASGKTVPARAPSRGAGSDDEGSTISDVARANHSCGACRTRESDTWWKAPKGLATTVLCDNCGISWRKYADLNVRPLREETIAAKSKAGDKREEVSFSDASKLRLVEGVSTIPEYRWMNKCTLCDSTGGAVVRCSDCPAEYHVSCAWKAGHKFGFEMQAVKSSRRETTIVIDFKDGSGCMVPLVTCKGHPVHRRQTYGICETNDAGDTALQVYAKTYKQAQVENTHGLLRKAQRLDSILNPDDSAESEISQSNPDPQCAKCRTEFSPHFYPTPPSTPPDDSTPSSMGLQTWLCHRCHFIDEHNSIDRMQGIILNGKATNGINGILSS
ncbi:hypothetical protein EW026_g3722 [Hermanssonia centrifuga]|uniref:Uncharacterized protein n=1 Tax=Hermanssonia centrifuga TaxID=98765 RepID=A0A4S4KJB6_9APHY|nr:hypothetical protein EW026_g3722 [Hermanssonia centrifuga]